MVVIALSGMPGCGSSTVGELLAKKLRIEYFSVGKYNKSLAEKFSAKPAASLTETERSLAMWNSEKGKSSGFHNDCEKMAADKAKKGNVVIEGKLAIRMVHADFKVWLYAPVSVRAERMAGRDKVQYNVALQQLEEKETTERTMWKKIYGFDYFDQAKEADIMIDTSDKPPEEIVDIIIKRIG